VVACSFCSHLKTIFILFSCLVSANIKKEKKKKQNKTESCHHSSAGRQRGFSWLLSPVEF